MKDKLYYGLISGILSPFLFVSLLYIIRFHYLSIQDFIYQAFFLKVQFKIIAVSTFFADLGIFYLFLYLKKNNAAKGVIFSVFIYFFIMLFFSIF